MKSYWYRIVFLVLPTGLFAQDPSFVNTIQSLTLLNPSFAGSNGGVRTQAVYNPYVWTGRYGFSAFRQSADAYIRPIRGGVAVNYLNNRIDQGAVVYNEIGITYAQYFWLGKDLQIIPSLQYTYINRQLNPTGVKFYCDYPMDPMSIYYDGYPLMPNIESKKNAYDLGSGLLVRYKNLYVGTSLLHMNRPDIGLPGLQAMPRQLNVHASSDLHTGHRSLLNISGTYTHQDAHRYGRLSLTGLFMNHLITALGYGTAYKQSTAFASVGYRNRFAAFILTFGTRFDDSYLSCIEAGLSFSFRKNDPVGEPVNCEKW